MFSLKLLLTVVPVVFACVGCRFQCPHHFNFPAPTPPTFFPALSDSPSYSSNAVRFSPATAFGTALPTVDWHGRHGDVPCAYSLHLFSCLLRVLRQMHIDKFSCTHIAHRHFQTRRYHVARCAHICFILSPILFRAIPRKARTIANDVH